jgi:hypothetical protein
MGASFLVLGTLAGDLLLAALDPRARRNRGMRLRWLGCWVAWVALGCLRHDDTADGRSPPGQ